VNTLQLLGFLILMALIPVAPFLVARWVRNLVDVCRAVDALQREQRTGETLAKTAEALADDAHQWRGFCADEHEITDERHGINGERESLDSLTPFQRSHGRLFRDGQSESIVSYAIAQPPPQNSSGPALWPLIISELGDSETDRLVAADMLARHEFGVAKYGVPLVASNGRDHLADAYQEALDSVVYLRAACESNAPIRVHQCYVDMLDLAKELREVIAERDG
jgi:hypothetical protein